MNNIHELKNSQSFEEQQIYEFFIVLLDKLFEKHDNIRIDSSTETETNHDIIRFHWKMIQQCFKVSPCVKRNQKLVRQTLLAIVSYLNKTYMFKQPIRFEHQRYDYRDKEIGKKIAVFWTELYLI